MSESAPTTLVVPPAALAGDVWPLTDDAFHHLVRVKRLTEGDVLRLVDGRGRARAATLAAIGKREARAILGAEATTNEPRIEVTLFVAPPKPERAAWLVEKATEVGVVAIRFVETERAARSLSPSQLDRLRRVAIAAVEQCGRATVPRIDNAGSLATTLRCETDTAMPRIVLDTAGPTPLTGAFSFPSSSSSTGPKSLALYVGPEGGWTDAERALFSARGAKFWSLGERALRVETAAVVAAGVALATV